MKEAIRKEIAKLVDVGLMYPISNSSWAGHVHVVPK